MIEKLYTVYFSEVANFLTTLTKNRSDAEDITQETFLRAMSNLDLLERLSPSQCRGWLYRTAKNIFIDRVRRAARASAEEAMEAYTDDLGAVAVAELLDKLPQEEADLFRLRYFSGYNSSELSALLSIPPGTIRSRLSSARKKLKKML